MQLQDFLVQCDIHEKFLSGFKPCHSTETALLWTFDDLILTADSGDSAILVLWDLAAAFDAVDHMILLSHLENYVGIKGTALKRFQSYLTDRSFPVHLGDYSSQSAALISGVPQGSVLGPILLSLYMWPLGQTWRQSKSKEGAHGFCGRARKNLMTGAHKTQLQQSTAAQKH